MEYSLPEYLYHGTSKSNLEQILANKGELETSYWCQSYETALYYGIETAETDDSPEVVVLKVPLSRFKEFFIRVDSNAIAEPISTLMIDNEDEAYDKWRVSAGTWSDCLNIYGSIYYSKAMVIEESDVHKITAVVLAEKNLEYARKDILTQRRKRLKNSREVSL